MIRATTLLLLCSIIGAAELEKITTTDNRVLIGYYDENTGTMTLDGKVGGAVTISKSQIASRIPYVKPGTNDVLERLKDEERKANAERERAVSEAAKFRAFAEKQTGPQEAIAKANAESSMKEAERLAKVVGDLRQKIAEVEKERQSATPITSTPGTKNTNGLESLDAARLQAKKLRDQAAQIEFTAHIAWIEREIATPVERPAIVDDPKKSEQEAHDRAMYRYNRYLELKEILRDSKIAEGENDHMQIVYRVREILEKEAKGIERLNRRR